MHKITTIAMAMFASLCLLFTTTSCSDDNDEPSAPAAKSVEGTYFGDMSCTVMGSEDIFEDMTFVVKATDDSTVEVTTPVFGNPPMQMPSVVVPDVKVSGTDGNYTLAPTTYEGTTESGKKYSVVLQGSFSGGQLTINFNLQYGAMPMPMICSFTAPKQ